MKIYKHTDNANKKLHTNQQLALSRVTLTCDLVTFRSSSQVCLSTSSRRLISSTFAPRNASELATDFPKPVPPPVMNAVLFENVPGGSIGVVFGWNALFPNSASVESGWQSVATTGLSIESLRYLAPQVVSDRNAAMAKA